MSNYIRSINVNINHPTNFYVNTLINFSRKINDVFVTAWLELYS